MDKVLIKKARAFLNKKDLKRKKLLHDRFRIAFRDFNDIIKMIIEKYEPVRIYQWGSLLDETTFSEISDIDIAVEGITSAKTFFAMYRDAEEFTRFPLHLVQIEKIGSTYAKWIKRDGKIIYEKC